MLAGCGGDPAPPAVVSPLASKTGGGGSKTAEQTISTQLVHRSVFTVAKDARDPFFPRSPRLRQKTAEGQPAAPQPIDLARELQDGFVGVMGTDKRRLALVHNTILHAGKEATIVFEVRGERQEVPVKCLDIQRNSVTLQVKGLAEPLRLTNQRTTQ